MLTPKGLQVQFLSRAPLYCRPYAEGGFSTADTIVALPGNSEDSRWGSSFGSAGITARLSQRLTTRAYYKTYFLDQKFGGNAEYDVWGCAVGMRF